MRRHSVSDVDDDIMQSDEVSTIIVSPKQSLLFRCQIQAYVPPYPVWKKDGEASAITLPCSSTAKEVRRFFFFF